MQDLQRFHSVLWNAVEWYHCARRSNAIHDSGCERGLRDGERELTNFVHPFGVQDQYEITNLPTRHREDEDTSAGLLAGDDGLGPRRSIRSE
jgi:hypothetical protein